ncbi:MAG: type IV secretory system conjugative DNA transfer family protein [Acidimicrobiales bacterium]
MVELLVLIAVAGLSVIGAIMAARWFSFRRWQAELVTFELRFPYALEPGAVTAFLGGLAGLVAPRPWHQLSVRAVVIEVSAAGGQIRHHLLVSQPQAGIVLAQLRAALPNVTVHADPAYRSASSTLAGELGLADGSRPLRTDQPIVVAHSLLASLQPLDTGERLVVQYTLSPVGPVAPVRREPRRTTDLSHLLTEGHTRSLRDPDALRAARTKQATPLFRTAVRIGVVAEPSRARALLGRLTAAFHAANAPGAHLHRRPVPSRWTVWTLSQRAVPLVAQPCLLNAGELTGLTALPLASPALPGLVLGGCRQLAPAATIPTQGRVVARSTFPGGERPLALSVTDSLQHLHVIGPTGVGKSTLLLNLITADMAAGRGVVVLDPKGDLVTDVLDRVPAQRTGDVVLLDPSDETRPVGLNLLAGADHAPELTVDQVVGLFHQLYRAFWGPRTDDILRSALLTLVAEPGMTLCEVPLLLTDPGVRRRLIGRLDDPVALGPFWAWYEAMSDAERAAAVGPVLNKLRAFLLRRRIRNVIGQPDSAFDLDRALADGAIVLVALAKGLLGDEAAALIGSLFVARLWQAVQHRASQPAAERRPVFAYIDEVQDYLHLPTSIGDVLAQARGLGLGLTLAHQHLGQLPPDLRQGILANARSRVIFQTAADDARVLAKELAPHLTAADLHGLGAREVVVSLATGAQVAPPATGVTLPPPPLTGQAAAVRAASRLRYGQDRAAVEAAIRGRHTPQRGPGGVGRTSRRAS